jgi:hypothetical protein
MRMTVDQQNTATVRGPSQAVQSLNREFCAVLVSEEAATIGRAAAQIVRGDGWHEARASVVLVEALRLWLGADAVQPLGYFANGTGPVEILGKVGKFYFSGHGIDVEEDVAVNCSQRNRGARFSASYFEEVDISKPNPRMTMGTPLARQAAERMAELFAEELDAEIARVILGV